MLHCLSIPGNLSPPQFLPCEIKRFPRTRPLAADVRIKTFSAHVMAQNDADVSESPGFTHVAVQIIIGLKLKAGTMSRPRIG